MKVIEALIRCASCAKVHTCAIVDIVGCKEFVRFDDRRKRPHALDENQQEFRRRASDMNIRIKDEPE